MFLSLKPSDKACTHIEAHIGQVVKSRIEGIGPYRAVYLTAQLLTGISQYCCNMIAVAPSASFFVCIYGARGNSSHNLASNSISLIMLNACLKRKINLSVVFV